MDPWHRCPPDRAPGLTLDASADLTARSHDPHPLEKTHSADSDSGEHLVDRPRRREESRSSANKVKRCAPSVCNAGAREQAKRLLVKKDITSRRSLWL